MSIQYQKTKSVAKMVLPKGKRLTKVILETMKTISDAVGVTLGPGGNTVMIERYEHDIPPMITKDGVTVFRAIGFNDPVAQCIAESTRDAAVRTANEAGDGTTTATILAEAITRRMFTYCEKHPQESPQKVVRTLAALFREYIEPLLRHEMTKLVLGSKEEPKDNEHLKAVALVSANGDKALADAVMECYSLVGDEGSVTIMEVNGKSSYAVESINGYPVDMGYDESCGAFYPKFINNQGRQSCDLEDPVFLLYHGSINDPKSLQNALGLIGDELNKGANSTFKHFNVVVVATGFSESVLGTLATNFAFPETINVYPLLVPRIPVTNGQKQFLDDIAAVTGATVLDQLSRPLDSATLEDFGPGLARFESTKWKSILFGREDEESEEYAKIEELILERVADLEQLLKNPDSEYDTYMLNERLGKLTGGIARLKVIGSSNGETKERRDRAEDAICAVRGAIKHGCLPGGGWGLLRLLGGLPSDGNKIVDEILAPALFEPVNRLLDNCGLNSEEKKLALEPVTQGIRESKKIVYDALERRHGDAFELGILDSYPAVIEAIRNSLSIASQLGTTGAAVVFHRDYELERSEASASEDWKRNANWNPADERP